MLLCIPGQERMRRRERGGCWGSVTGWCCRREWTVNIDCAEESRCTGRGMISATERSSNESYWHGAGFGRVAVTVCRYSTEQVLLRYPGDESLKSPSGNPKLRSLSSDQILTFCSVWLILMLQLKLSAQLRLSFPSALECASSPPMIIIIITHTVSEKTHLCHCSFPSHCAFSWFCFHHIKAVNFKQFYSQLLSTVSPHYQTVTLKIIHSFWHNNNNNNALQMWNELNMYSNCTV